MTHVQGNVVRMQASQMAQAVAVMGRAFINDELLVFLVPDEVRRARFSPAFIGIPVKACHYQGQVWTTPNVDGAACWMLPGRADPSLGVMLRCGMLSIPFRLGQGGFKRFSAVLAHTEALHKKLAPEPHWYLWGLGVDPARQGQGLGSQLLEPGLRQADEAGLRCYLETMNGANLPFYERHGFKVVNDSILPGHGLRVWAMQREARGTGKGAAG